MARRLETREGAEENAGEDREAELTFLMTSVMEYEVAFTWVVVMVMVLGSTPNAAAAASCRAVILSKVKLPDMPNSAVTVDSAGAWVGAAVVDPEAVVEE